MQYYHVKTHMFAGYNEGLIEYFYEVHFAFRASLSPYNTGAAHTVIYFPEPRETTSLAGGCRVSSAASN